MAFKSERDWEKKVQTAQTPLNSISVNILFTVEITVFLYQNKRAHETQGTKDLNKRSYI